MVAYLRNILVYMAQFVGLGGMFAVGEDGPSSIEYWMISISSQVCEMRVILLLVVVLLANARCLYGVHGTCLSRSRDADNICHIRRNGLP